MGLDFTGLGLDVAVPDSPSLAATPTYSFSAWILASPLQTGNQGPIYNKTNPVFAALDFGPFFQIGLGPLLSRKLAVWVGGTLPTAWHVSTGDVSTIFDYQHVGATFDGSTVRFYINGAFDSLSAGITGVPNNPLFPVHIGMRPDFAAVGYQGAIEDLRFYNRVLSANEMLTIHALQGRDGIVNGRQARWLMRGEVGTIPPAGTIGDSSGNGNNGTQSGGVPYVPSRTLTSKRSP